MLLVGDLGLLRSATAVAVVVLVGLLLVRRKWQRVVARREEIKRLMALASEEAARAEFEVVAGYERSYGYPVAAAELVEEETVVGSGLGSSPGRQVQYQCKVCLCPTTTRCKQCKTVHYCSGKCQIIHWRQGHKDECRLLSIHQNFDAGAHSYPKDFNQEEFGSTSNGIGIETMHTDQPVKSSSGDVFPNSTHHVLRMKDGTKVEASDDKKETDVDAEATVNSLHGEWSPPSIESNRNGKESKFTKRESMKPLLSKQHILSNSGDGIAASRVSNGSKSDFFDTDELSESSTSSSCSITGSEEHSLSEPHTPSSGFWRGTLEPCRTRIDAPDDVGNADRLHPGSSCFSSVDRSKVHVEMLGNDMNKVLKDDPRPAASFLKKSTDEAVLSEVNEDVLKSREQLTRSSEVSNHISSRKNSVQCTTKLEQCDASSKNSHEHRTAEVEVSSSQFLPPKQSDNKTDDLSSIANNAKYLKNDSPTVKASRAHLSSSAGTRKHAVLDLHSMENECASKVDVASLGNNDYVRIDRHETLPSARRVIDKFKASNVIQLGPKGAGSAVRGRYEGSFPYELFVKLYNWNKVELRPFGLINCGNSCYANAVFQCLTFTPPLTAYFVQGFHSKSCGKKEWCFTCEFERMVKKGKDSYSPLSPAQIISQMQCIGVHLGNGREEDAHEFLRYAIEAMQSDCLKEARVNLASPLDEETTLMGLTFGGYLRSKIECMKCGGMSEQHERIMDLTVEIGGDIGTLEDALRQFTRSEILDGENKYNCGRCKSYEKAKKKLRVSEAPNVLTIALKRFQSGKFGKLNKAVKFPEILNLAPYMSGTSDKSPIYVLYGVVVHLDIMNAAFSGHYVCYIKNNQGRWFQADDSTVQAVDLQKVLCKDAYMLLYARCSPRAPRSIRSQNVPHEPKVATTPASKFKSHATESWGDTMIEPNTETCRDSFYLHSVKHHHYRADMEDDYSSENSSSFFSESGSYSTESSNRVSTSTDENFDHILTDMPNYWRSPWVNTSDSDTSSSSSSSLSPMHPRHSPLSDMNRYSPEAETSSSSHLKEDRGSSGTRSNNKTEASSRLVGSSSCRENDSSRLGGKDSRDNMKGVYLRRSMTGRTTS